MGNIPKPELERIHYERMRHVHIFLNNILFRNMHEHSTFEVDVILEGTGKFRGSEGEYCVQTGDVLLFNPYEPHEITAEKTGALQVLSLQISNHFCQEYFPSFPNVEFGVHEVNRLLTKDELQELRELAFSVALAFYQEQPAFQFECVGKTCSLLTALMRKLPHVVIADADYSVRKNKTDRIRRIVSYIDQHYKEKISLAALAEMEGITTTHLSHFFSDAFQMSFQDYLNNLRLEKALVLMKDPSLYMVDVCMECGFSSTRYLNQMFMKEFGCTALEYRDRCLSSGEQETESKVPISYAEFQHGRQESLEILRQHLGGGEYERLSGIMISTGGFK